MKHIIELENISKQFPGVTALQNVSFSIDVGEIHAIVGENGAGKSTLINILGGQYAATTGKIKYKENNIKLEVIEKEDSYIINLEKGEKIATLSLRMPNSRRYYYIHYEEITNNFAHYDWYDEEYHTVFEIAKQLSIILDRFLWERKNVSISTGK